MAANFVNLTVDHGELQSMLGRTIQLSRRGNEELRRGLNAGGAKVKTQVQRAVATQMGIGYGAAGKTMAATPARAGGTMEYTIKSVGQWVPLMAFGARAGTAGVYATPWETRRLFPHTFIATMSSGHTGVFTRIAGKKIKELWGGAVPREMLRGESLATFEHSAADVVMPAIMSRLAGILGA